MGELVDKDQEQLRLLTLFYYVNAGTIAFLSFCVGGTILIGPDAPPARAFAIAGAVLFLLGLAYPARLVSAGRFLAQRRHRLFCLVIAGINCLFLPYGTILGVFTFVVLMRPSVEAPFAGAPPPLPPARLE